MIYTALDPIVMILLVVNLLLVGLAWWNFKETRQLIDKAGKSIQDFLDGEAAGKIAAGLMEIKQAEKVREEFLHHTHGTDGKVQ